MTLIIIATIIYLQIFGEYQDILMYSIFGTVGLTMALGSVAAVRVGLTWWLLKINFKPTLAPPRPIMH